MAEVTVKLTVTPSRWRIMLAHAMVPFLIAAHLVAPARVNVDAWIAQMANWVVRRAKFEVQ